MTASLRRATALHLAVAVLAAVCLWVARDDARPRPPGLTPDEKLSRLRAGGLRLAPLD